MIDYQVKIFNEKNLKKKFTIYVLGIDIGGTNTNITVAGLEKTKPILLFSLNFESQKLNSLIPAINKTLSYTKKNFGITVKYSCIGAAGVVSPKNDFAKHTKLSWDVNSKEILKNTSLEKAFVINDFQGIGYAINILNKKTEDFLNELTSLEVTVE